MSDINFEDIHPSQFSYELPEEYIAKEPLQDRSKSRLLYYNKGLILHQKFHQIANLVPDDSLIVFNDTKVIPARLVAYKPTGARIEIFLLEPIAPSTVTEEAMSASKSCTWECMIGNAKKWKTGSKLEISLEGGLTLSLIRDGESTVTLDWGTDAPFTEIIEKAGRVPLPPYIDREPTELDIPRYQTVYSKIDGAVAAPTAGLHFTDELIQELGKKSLIDYVTLHVSAGTFQPIKTNAIDHDMHREEIIIHRSTIVNILSGKPVVAVGTTSMRTLESIYWYGVKLLGGTATFEIEKLYPYKASQAISLEESLKSVIDHMDSTKSNHLRGHTEIFIFPGYTFRVCQGLVTNFHLPGTTLMMLVAAFAGKDWESIYEKALEQHYRFLSYGDASFLIPEFSNLET